MKLEMATKKLCLITSDEGETLKWDVSVFHRTNATEAEDIFGDVNGFLNSLQKERRAEIWRAYCKVDNALMTITDHRALTTEIAACVKNIYDQFDLEEIDTWMTAYRDVTYPPSVVSPTQIRGLPAKHGMLRGSVFEKYEDDSVIQLIEEADDSFGGIYSLRISSDTTRPPEAGGDNQVYNLSPWVTGRTYLTADYYGMVILAVALRFMVPVWGMYFKSTLDVFGNEMKEYRGIDLLRDTTILDSVPVCRLEKFIESFLTKDYDLTGAIINGMARDQVPDWMLSMALIRRVALGEYDGPAERASIIAGVYRFIDNQFNGIDKRFGMVHERTPAGGDKEEEKSRAELTRVKQRETVLDEEFAAYFFEREDGLAAARKFDDSISAKLVATCLDHIHLLNHTVIVPEQQRIVQLVTQDHVVPQLVETFDKLPLVRSLGVVMALCWHWGFTDLAVMLSSTAIAPSMDAARPPEQRMVVSDELIDEFAIYYPMTTAQDADNHRKSNLAYQGLMGTSKRCRDWNWYAHLPPELVAERGVDLGPDGSFKLPTNLLEQLVKLAIHIQIKMET